LVVDAALVNLGIIASFLLRFSGRLPSFNFEAYTGLAVAITVMQVAAFYIYDLYNIEKAQAGWEIFYSVLKAVTLGFLLIVFVTFFYRFFSFPRTVLILSWAMNLAVITGWRLLAAVVLTIKWPTRRVLIVGSGEASKEILRELKDRSQLGYEVVGLVDRDPGRVGSYVDGAKILGTTQDIIPLVQENHISQLIVTTPIRHRELVEDLSKSMERYVRVDVIPDLYEIVTGKVDYTLMSDIPLVELTKEPVPPWVFSTKRILDLLLAGLAFIVAFPFMLLAAFAVKLNSKGPIIYKQRRVGQHERVFSIYKFRTMVEGAEEETGPVFAAENDPRITLVGRILRRTRIDELPQLLNILKGEMSFVGPRPERPVFVDEFKEKVPGYVERFRIKPGVTGLAQVSGFYATTAQNKLKYDLIYVYHQSLFLDLKILLHTLKVVLTGRGAQ
jgi:exopolysaccharide biosynthesis polyprenyl glycosylphosphotransferase